MTDAKIKDLYKRVDQALDQVRPHLKVDGGDIELIEVTDDYKVFIKWLGNCSFCTMSTMTMKAGVEQTIKSRVPEIKDIVAINGIGLNG